MFEAGGVVGVYNLGVQPSLRRLGIATELLRWVLGDSPDAVGSDGRALAVVAQAPRPHALPLFRALGFRPIGVCRRWVEPQYVPLGEQAKRS